MISLPMKPETPVTTVEDGERSRAEEAGSARMKSDMSRVVDGSKSGRPRFARVEIVGPEEAAELASRPKGSSKPASAPHTREQRTAPNSTC